MTAKISALQFIFFMTLSVQANSQPDLFSYGAKDSSQSTILNSRQLFQQTNCEKIKSDPELRPFLKTCDDVFQTQHSLDQSMS